MIKRIREITTDARIGAPEYRAVLEGFESEILRGISTLLVLEIIDESGAEGSYGYQVLKDLEEKTGRVLVIEEGTLYPILRKLEKDGLLSSDRKSVDGRERKYYTLTAHGASVLNHMIGFFHRLVESIGKLIDIERMQASERFFYCPNCSNKIDLLDGAVHYCEACGLRVDDLKDEVKNNE